MQWQIKCRRVTKMSELEIQKKRQSQYPLKYAKHHVVNSFRNLKVLNGLNDRQNADELLQKK